MSIRTTQEKLPGGGGVWGSITGTLSDQTDLQTALDAKVGGSGEANRVAYFSGTSTLTSSANLNYNGTNFGIGVSASYPLDVNGNTYLRSSLGVGIAPSTDYTAYFYRSASTSYDQYAAKILSSTTTSTNAGGAFNARAEHSTGTSRPWLRAAKEETYIYSGSITSCYGLEGYCQSLNGSTLTNGTGCSFQTWTQGTVTTAVGGQFSVAASFNSSVPTATGGLFQVGSINAGRVTNGYFLRASAFYGGSFSGTSIGLWLESSIDKGATQYAIKSDSVGMSYFAGKMGIGADGTTAMLTVRKTTEQIRTEYDASNYFSTTVDSTGGVTFDAVGSGSKFTFADDTYVNSELFLTKTTEQLRVRYDASNYWSTTIDSTGIVTFDAVGSGAKFVFSDDIDLSTKNLVTDTTTGTKIATGNTQKLGFWGTNPVVQQVTNAYTSDSENIAYTGIDNTQVGTVYAQVADLNNLRVAYETLRASYDDLLTKLKNTGIVA